MEDRLERQVHTVVLVRALSHCRGLQPGSRGHTATGLARRWHAKTMETTWDNPAEAPAPAPGT